jgi:y4mF family transcriptional regulator
MCSELGKFLAKNEKFAIIFLKRNSIFMEISSIKDIGQIIRTARKSQNLTQRDIALATGIGLRLIVDLENGSRSVGLNNVIKICQLLNLKINIE